MPTILKFPSKKNRFTVIIQPHLSALFKYAWKLTGNRDDAEDLLQTVLCRLYPKTSEWEGNTELRRWLYKVVHNAYIDELRYRNRRADLAGHGAEDPDLLADPAKGPEQQKSLSQNNDRILEALDTLPPEQRSVVVLHLLEGFSLPEVAEIQSEPLGTLKSRLHRAKEKLKILLDVEPFAHD